MVVHYIRDVTSPADEEAKPTAENALDSAPEDLIGRISTHAIFKLDSDGSIGSWSESAQSLYGYESTAIVHRDFSDLFADEEGPNPDLEAAMSAAKTGAHEIEHWNKRADGSVFWATMTLAPLGGDDFLGYVVISQDTTGKKQYEQMLERQNDRLKEFTDILAHDLRNPLNVIEGRLELYRTTQDEEHIEKIEATTERMKRLVDDLLRVARQGNVVKDPESVTLMRVTERAWEGTGAMRTGASLIYEPVPSVGADYDRLCEMFENLFSNAIEHGGSDVTVRVGPLERGFYVEDNGPGIPLDHQDEVFDHGYTSTETGSGYGLSVVRTIINAHGWDVRAVDSASGGARFEITGVEFLD